jgi:hypothetical protein
MVRWLMSWKVFERNEVVVWARYCPSFCLEKLRETTRNLRMDVPAEIRTKH